ncbi:hypothetical protein ACE939_12735 [Aquimarina sp. W85]|uniref:hypothetical protein n=1 Tax=Aquimarina rhodophyticola TaxID=3342246 RepID=UPI00366F8B90
MKIVILKTFASDYQKINDTSLEVKLKSVLRSLETLDDTSSLTPIQRIQDKERFFKIGIGFYYILIKCTSAKTLALVRMVHRDQVKQSLYKSI